MPVDPVADADLLDRDRRLGHMFHQHGDDLARVERDRAEHLDGRVGEHHRPVARHRQHRAGPVAGQAELVPDVGDAERRATGREHDVGARVDGPVDRLLDSW